MAAAVAVADTRQLNAVVDGHRSMGSYLRAELNYSRWEANRWLGLAKMVNAHAAVGEAWMAGHIGVPQAMTFARTHANRRVRDRLPEFVPVLVEHAERLPHPDFAACADEFVRRADLDGAHDERDHAITHRRASVVEVGGALHVDMFGGDGLVTAEMIAIHRRFTEYEFHNDVEMRRDDDGSGESGDLPRTAGQRSYDAIVEIFRRAARSDVPGRAVEPVVNIVIDAHTFARMQAASGLAPAGGDGWYVDPFTGLSEPAGLIDDMLGDPATLEHRRCETTTGVALHPHDVLRAALAGHVRRVVVDSADVVIDLGRKSRLYTGSAREAAKLLVRHCQRPGCELPTEFCDVDHNDEWVDDAGATDQRNAAILCRTHNKDKYRHRWRRRRAGDGRVYTVRADGTIMLPVGARGPDLLDELEVLREAATDTDTDSDDPWDDPDEWGRSARLARQRLAVLARWQPDSTDDTSSITCRPVRTPERG
jgi:hypothetical protein